MENKQKSYPGISWGKVFPENQYEKCLQESAQRGMY